AGPPGARAAPVPPGSLRRRGRPHRPLGAAGRDPPPGLGLSGRVRPRRGGVRPLRDRRLPDDRVRLSWRHRDADDGQAAGAPRADRAAAPPGRPVGEPRGWGAIAGGEVELDLRAGWLDDEVRAEFPELALIATTVDAVPGRSP